MRPRYPTPSPHQRNTLRCQQTDSENKHRVPSIEHGRDAHGTKAAKFNWQRSVCTSVKATPTICNDRYRTHRKTLFQHTHSPVGKAVAAFFTPLSKKEPEKMMWRVVHDSLLVGRYGAGRAIMSALSGKIKIAAFDFDSTLVTPASGKKFSRNANDWKWWHASVPGRLKELHEDGYRLAIVSNQGGISLKEDGKTAKSDAKRLADFKTKVSSVLHQLDLPISMYAATGRDQYRKPRMGMWHEIAEDFDLDSTHSLDVESSVFVGDAGGRVAVDGGPDKDHSCVDRCVPTSCCQRMPDANKLH